MTLRYKYKIEIHASHKRGLWPQASSLIV